MKLNPNIPVWLDRTILTGPYLSLALSQKEFDSLTAALGEPPEPWIPVGTFANACVHQFTRESGRGTCCIVCLNPSEGASGTTIAALIVHEAVHVKQAFMQDIGEDKPSSEFEAYTVQAICQELFGEYARRLGA
jgi:hypothetical protein